MPIPRTLRGALAEAVDSNTGFTFLEGGVERNRSYAELLASARGVAGALRQTGLRPGDVVALVVADAEQFLSTLFGTVIAGLVPASVYPPAATADLPRYLAANAGVVQASGARAIVTSSALADGFERYRGAGGAQVLRVEHLASDPLDRDAEPLLDDVAFVQFTSGSTSSPKGVALTHRNISANIEAIIGPDGLSVTHDDVAVSWLPLYHDMGLVGMALCALYAGCHAVLLTPQAFVKRPVEWLRAISTHGGTVSFAPNFAYDLCVRRIRDREMAGLDLSKWRVAGCGAEPVHAPTLAAFAERFGAVGFRDTSFLPSYGLAEHVVAASLAPVGRAPLVRHVSASALAARGVADAPSDGEAVVALVGCGRAFPGHALRIVDERGTPLPDDHVGEIVLSGPSVMAGYFGRDAPTGDVIRDGWLRTGDLGFCSSGELFVCGRSKDLIIVNGRKYHPQDLERAVDDIAGLRRGRVVAFGTAQAGGADRVVVVAEPAGAAAPAQLVDAIRKRIGGVFGIRVDDVALVPSGTIGRTTSGKVQRAPTRARYERGELVEAQRIGVRA